MSQTAGIIKPDGTRETRQSHGKKFELNELQEMVGGSIELVHLKPGHGHKTAYVNEEGKLEGLAINPEATKIVRLSPDDFVVGNLVIVGGVR